MTFSFVSLNLPSQLQVGLGNSVFKNLGTLPPRIKLGFCWQQEGKHEYGVHYRLSLGATMNKSPKNPEKGSEMDFSVTNLIMNT